MEHEIQGHAKKAYKKWKDPKASLWHKIKEIAMEVAIIVFAVSISIWFHNMSEKRHHRHEVKAFLTDLKAALVNDSTTIQTAKNHFKGIADEYTVIKDFSVFQLDSIKKSRLTNNKPLINFSYSFRQSNNAAYEGFKSSGKIGYIEDAELKTLILSYYQQFYPSMELLENDFTKKADKLSEVMKFDDLVLIDLLQGSKEAKNITGKCMVSVGANIQMYDGTLGFIRQMIAKIDRDLKH
jgi:hypothetical protein